MMKTSRAQMDRLLDQWQLDAEEPHGAEIVDASQGRSFDAQGSFAKRASPQARHQQPTQNLAGLGQGLRPRKSIPPGSRPVSPDR
jgi:hypothetical protein